MVYYVTNNTGCPFWVFTLVKLKHTIHWFNTASLYDEKPWIMQRCTTHRSRRIWRDGTLQVNTVPMAVYVQSISSFALETRSTANQACINSTSPAKSSLIRNFFSCAQEFRAYEVVAIISAPQSKGIPRSFILWQELLVHSTAAPTELSWARARPIFWNREWRHPTLNQCVNNVVAVVLSAQINRT